MDWLVRLLIYLSVCLHKGLSFVGDDDPTTMMTVPTEPPVTVGVESPQDEPYFDSMTPRNVTALEGRAAELPCRVHNLGNRSVAWVRLRDNHILTLGPYSYTQDQRFQARRLRNVWTLIINWAQHTDAGLYECQITSPMRSLTVQLDVVVPTASILEGPDFYVNKDSTINLTCIVKHSPEPPAFIFWYHGDEEISYDSTRGGVSVATDKGEETTSRLLVQRATSADSGKYVCRPSNAHTASIQVHVLDGERPEAMQTSQGANIAGAASSFAAVAVGVYAAYPR